MSTTVTLYPSLDGYTYRYIDSGETFSTLAGGNGTVGGSNDSQVAHFIYAGDSTNTWRYINRMMIVFDTSSIPDTATIDSVIFSIYCPYKYFPATLQDYLVISPGTTTTNTSIIAADYQLNTSPVVYASIPYSTLSTGGNTPNAYYDFTFNATGRNAISKTGLTKIAMKWASDASVTAPTWSASAYAQFNVYLSEQADFKPKLTITYTEGAPVTTILTSPTTVAYLGGTAHY